jgi:hypothetical protein
MNYRIKRFLIDNFDTLDFYTDRVKSKTSMENMELIVPQSSKRK